MVLKVAVIGASGIGKYHVKEFFNRGANVVSILGRTEESTKSTAQMLKKSFGVVVKPYESLEEMLKEEKIDAVSICTNPETHEDFTRRCLERGLHVLCEKPFVTGNGGQIYSKSLDLLNLAKKKGKILTVNTQWPAVLEFFYERNNPPLERLGILMEPGRKGREMLIDMMPHANSILTRLIKNGNLRNLHIDTKSERETDISFDYVSGNAQVCKVNYHFSYNPKRPRKVEFIFNGNRFIRKVDGNYQQSFVNGQEQIAIPDPLGVSIQRFIDSIEKKGVKPLISDSEILDSARITDHVINEYDKT